ncbi:MAG: hypothetical protein NT003_00305, partial [Candidatus Magasanikbacteria bacterium]|nr:hypothetical protein [Candidatus Magasanikbacteria bacterium]
VLLATKILSDTIHDAICLTPTEQAYVIFDTEAPLAQILLEGYRNAIPNATFIDFSSTSADAILALFNSCKPGDLVVLLQSSNFRLNEFRVRIELFQRGLKTIEHMHLYRMTEDQFETYINTLAYDADYYRPLGRALKTKIEAAKEIVVECRGTKLIYATPMEEVKLNIGDYHDMKNVGGTFPIGEVFTEAADLTTVNGDAMVFSYANEEHIVQIVEPFRVHIEKGILTAPDAPEEFRRILDLIREDEEVIVREFGIGLNPAVGKHALINDITAFERQKGMHVSLGAKHAVYAKPGLNRKKGRYHIDIFIDIETISADGVPFFKDGEFV